MGSRKRVPDHESRSSRARGPTTSPISWKLSVTQSTTARAVIRRSATVWRPTTVRWLGRPARGSGRQALAASGCARTGLPYRAFVSTRSARTGKAHSAGKAGGGTSLWSQGVRECHLGIHPSCARIRWRPIEPPGRGTRASDEDYRLRRSSRIDRHRTAGRSPGVRVARGCRR